MQHGNMDQKLNDVLALLEANWTVEDYQLAGMGWAAVIASGQQKFTLHSDRGAVAIYRGDYQNQQLLSTVTTAADIAASIQGNLLRQAG